MKQFKTLVTMALLAVIVASCSVSQNTVGGGLFQKRKYTKGFYFNRHSNGKVTSSDESSALRKEENDEVEVAALVVKAEEKAVLTAESHSVSQDFEIIKEDLTAENDGVVSGDMNNETTSTLGKENGSEESVQALTEKDCFMMKKHSGLKSVDTGDPIMLVLLVILAIIIPPLAVLIYEGATKRFWIDLILAILGWGIGFALLGASGWLLGLIAVIYALLIVLGLI